MKELPMQALEPQFNAQKPYKKPSTVANTCSPVLSGWRQTDSLAGQPNLNSGEHQVNKRLK